MGTSKWRQIPTYADVRECRDPIPNEALTLPGNIDDNLGPGSVDDRNHPAPCPTAIECLAALTARYSELKMKRRFAASAGRAFIL